MKLLRLIVCPMVCLLIVMLGSPLVVAENTTDGDGQVITRHPELKVSGAGVSPDRSLQKIAGKGDSATWRITITDETDGPVWINVPLGRAVEAEQRVRVSFRMRCTESGEEAGVGEIRWHVIDGRSGKPIGEGKAATATRKWEVQQITLDVPPKARTLAIRGNPANYDQVIELSDVIVATADRDEKPGAAKDSKKYSYEGQAPDASWRAAAQKRIEKIRMGDLEVLVVDADGNAVADAKVTATLRRHQFGFGTVIGSWLIGPPKEVYEQGKLWPNKPIAWSDAKRYRELIPEHFNTVIFSQFLRPHRFMHIHRDEATETQKIIREGLYATLDWTQKHGFYTRGHYISWRAGSGRIKDHQTHRGKQMFLDTEPYLKYTTDYMKKIYPLTKGKVVDWDVCNHPIWGKKDADVVIEIFKRSRELAPHLTHSINEGQIISGGGRQKGYEELIRAMNEAGQAPDRVGFMAHFRNKLTPPEEMLKTYDRFGKFSKALFLSELDVLVNDEQLQADYLRDVIICAYSHPKVVAVIQWGFWEGNHWRSRAALWRKDWTIKPAGQAYLDLIHKTWHTDETTTTNAKGKALIRGYRGAYDIVVEVDGRTIKASGNLEGERAEVKVVSK